MGYMFTVTYQYVGAVYIFTLAAGLIFVGVGLYLFAAAGTKDIKMKLTSINKRGVLTENLSWSLSQLAEFIQYHSALKQLSADNYID